MACSDFLRKNIKQHIAKNPVSKKMDSDIKIAVNKLVGYLRNKYPELIFEHKKRFLLTEAVSSLSQQYPQYKKDFSLVKEKDFIRPDGGFLYATNKNGEKKIILIAEMKRQGTNNKRVKEGLPIQSKGNAVERLGKNLGAIRALFKKEKIIPFACFGNGYDFREGSSIVDRVVTMNDFFPLNNFFIEKTHIPFEPVSMFFRYKNWSVKELTQIMVVIAEKAIKHYFG